MNDPIHLDRAAANPLPSLGVFTQPVVVAPVETHFGLMIRIAWLCLIGQRRRAFWLVVRQQLRAVRAGQHPRFCKWGNHGMRYGDRRLPVSHGICQACRDRMFPSLKRTRRPVFTRPEAYR